MTDKKIDWVVFSRQTIDTHTNQRYTHHSTRPNKHIKKRKTQREERRMGNRSTNNETQPAHTIIPLFLLTNKKPTNNRKETALGCECLTYCLLVSHPPSFSLLLNNLAKKQRQTDRMALMASPSFLTVFFFVVSLFSWFYQ